MGGLAGADVGRLVPLAHGLEQFSVADVVATDLDLLDADTGKVREIGQRLRSAEELEPVAFGDGLQIRQFGKPEIAQLIPVADGFVGYVRVNVLELHVSR